MQSNRLPSLDGLRAISIILVLIAHGHFAPYFPHWLWLPDGIMGVWVFYVISGFLITHLMLKEETQTGAMSLKGFYRRRAFRILPIYWLFLGVVCLLWGAGVYRLHSMDILRPLTFTFPIAAEQGRSYITKHTWSLVVEENFYLIWPVSFVLLRSKVKRLAAIILVLLIVPLVRVWLLCHPTKAYLQPTILGYADFLAWGCCLALMLHNYRPIVLKVVQWRPMIGRILAVVIFRYCPIYFAHAFRHHDGWDDSAISMSVQAACIAYLIASFLLVQRGAAYKALNWRPLAWLGVLSYSLYIWQEIFLGMEGANGPRIWERFPLNLICVFAVAIVSYYFIEQPMLKFKRGIPKNKPKSRNFWAFFLRLGERLARDLFGSATA